MIKIPQISKQSLQLKRQSAYASKKSLIIKQNESIVNFGSHLADDHKKANAKKTDYLIKKILNYQDRNGKLIQKFTLNYLITLMDKNKIQTIDRVYRVKKEGFNLLQFIRFFLNAIEHSQNQTLYLTMGLVDLFKTVSQINFSTQRLKFIDLTDFICNNILCDGDDSKNTSNSDNKIEMKLIPEHKVIKQKYQIKDYMTNPPTIYGNKQQVVYKLSLSNTKIDKNKHDSVVTDCFFSKTYNRMFSLDSLSDSISVYDTNCKLTQKIRPANSKTKKDAVVLSFAYSQREQRIAAVLKDFTICFWDFVDNLQFQKVISTASHCPEYQVNIWYLQYFQNWITSDKTGTIYIWNLQKQIPQRKMECKFKGKINDICQIPCLNILAIAQQSQVARSLSKKQNEDPKVVLYNYFKGEEVAQISALIDMRIPHTLQYSQSYQVLLSAGFEKKINIFQINHKYLDTSLKGQLLGHQNLITSFILVKKTPMVVSSDDKGKVKIWDLRNYKCIQTLDFRDKTIITRLLDMVQVGKIAVLGSRINFLQYDQKTQITKKYQNVERNAPFQVSYVYQKNKLLVLTRKDVRLYNMQTGSVQKVFCDFHSKDQEIVVFKYYESMKQIVIGNQKGQIKLFNILSSKRKIQGNGNSVVEEKLQGYQNGLVTHIEYDQQNKLFLTCGANGTINVEKLIDNTVCMDQQIDWDEIKDHKGSNTRQQKIKRSKKWIIIRQMKGNFNNKQISILAFSVYHGMIAIGSTSSEIYIWDYQYAQILFNITLPDNEQPSAMTFLNGFSILIITTSSGQIYFVKLIRANENLNQGKKIMPQQLYGFKSSISKMTNSQQYNSYVTQILSDITLQGCQPKAIQTLQFAKIYLVYNCGHLETITITQVLSRSQFLPHRRSQNTYNPQRQLKQQFSVQLKKDKCIKLNLIQASIKLSDQFPYEIIKIHQGNVSSIKVLQFDQHYLVTCGANDQRVKFWINNQLVGDFNINLPLPYKWDFSIYQEKKNRDKIMFSLKIIQSIFKKFGTDISTGQSKSLKLQNFFKSLQNPMKDENNVFLTENIQSEQQKRLYFFQQQFTKTDLHYDEIKKYNFHEIGGPSLRQLDFKKKLQIMQKQWHVSKVKQQEEKNILLLKIQSRAQKNQQKEQMMSFLQDKNLIKKKIKKVQQQQFPKVKQLSEQMKKIENPQPLCLANKDQNLSFNNPSQIRNLWSMSSIGGPKLTKTKSSQLKQNIILTSMKKSDFGCVLRRAHIQTQKVPIKKAAFQEYYMKKQSIDAQSCCKTPDLSLQNSALYSNGKKDICISLNNSRVGSFNSSLAQQRNGRQFSFQKIMKDMNKRVLLSRQSRNKTVEHDTNETQNKSSFNEFKNSKRSLQKIMIRKQQNWIKKI